MTQPVLLPRDLEKLRALPPDRFRVGTLECLFDSSQGARGLERALDHALPAGLASRADAAHDPRALGPRRRRDALRRSRSCSQPPPFTATSCARASRTRCGLVVESGEPREVMHIALLIGYGAAAVSPYLALRLDRRAAGRRRPRRADRRRGAGALREGHRQGAPEGAARRWGSRPSRATAARRSSRPSASGPRSSPATSPARRRASAASGSSGSRRTPQPASAPPTRGEGLEAGGLYQFRIEGEHHVWNPDVDRRSCSAPCATRATRPSRRTRPRSTRPRRRRRRCAACSSWCRPASRSRSRRSSRPARSCVASRRVRCRSARSRSEAHETLAIAMNRLGARSNTGRGRRGSRALDARRERRPAPLGDQAGRLRRGSA